MLCVGRFWFYFKHRLYHERNPYSLPGFQSVIGKTNRLHATAALWLSNICSSVSAAPKALRGVQTGYSAPAVSGNTLFPGQLNDQPLEQA